MMSVASVCRLGDEKLDIAFIRSHASNACTIRIIEEPSPLKRRCRRDSQQSIGKLRRREYFYSRRELLVVSGRQFAIFSWFAIESVLLHRLYTVTTLPLALRPTMGIQLAPPTVGAVAHLGVNGGVPDLVAHALVGYGLLQALLLLRLLPWIMEQPFAVSYWSFTFGVTALATAPIRMLGHGDSGAIAVLAPYTRLQID